MANPHDITVERGRMPGHRPNGYQFAEIPIGVIEVADVTKGMMNRLPRDQSDPGSGRLIVNARLRDDWMGRRPGTAQLGNQPNGRPVLAVVTFISEAGQIHVCRVTDQSFHVLTPDQTTWVPYSIYDASGGATTFSGLTTRISFAPFFDNLFMTNGEVNRVWVIDFSAQTVREIEGAPRARFITYFGERIIAAWVRESVGGVRPSKLRWPVNANPFDWTGLGSGEEDLGANNVGDEITGIFGLERGLTILRRNSIWEGTRQPFANAPFRFISVIEGIGCDLPWSAVRVPGGLIFADQRTREVYIYRPGALPEPLGISVNRDLYEDIRNLDFAQAAYDPFEREYHLGITHASGSQLINRVWVLSLEKLAWSYDDSPIITCLGVVALPGTSPVIDELVGTIDAQNPSPSGVIDDYAGPGGVRPTLLKGTSDGRVLSQTYGAANDWDDGEFEILFRSQNLGSLARRRSPKDLELTIECGAPGPYSLYYLRDETSGTRYHEKADTTTSGRSIIRLPKTGPTSEDIFWELRSSAPAFKLKSWWMRILEKGSQRG